MSLSDKGRYSPLDPLLPRILKDSRRHRDALIAPVHAVAHHSTPCVAPSMDVADTQLRHRLALLARQHRRERRVRLGLIPVGDSRQVEGQAVRVPVLDRRPQGLLDVDRILEMEAVAVRSTEPTRLLVHSRVTEGRMVVDFLGTPRRAEVILRPRPMQRPRPRFAVDQEHVVALAVPERGGAVDKIVHSHVMPGAGRVDEDVVELVARILGLDAQRLPLVLAAVLTRLRPGHRPVPPRMKSPHVSVEAISVFLIVYVVVERRYRYIALILHRDPRPVGVRHRPETVQRPPLLRRGREGYRREIVILAPALPEKVADRRFHRGIGLAVPVHSNDGIATDHRILRPDRHPDMLDDARARHLRDRRRRPGGDRNGISIATAAVERRDTLGANVGPKQCEAVERAAHKTDSSRTEL